MKLGSLFDGSGGFPLAGALFGIEPVWASEIEPFPIRVTKQRFPGMKHLGSVTEVKGDQVEPVDIITFGSPCQDLSVAGKQLGIHDGERSNLFFEAIRIIKEMRDGTSNQYPRFAIWENVPGAFSSNKGADFQAVLQAFCDVSENGLSVPQPQGGRWKPAGCIVGNGFSVAWRVYDAQYWGVPQRRKRIYLIADFRSECAGRLLFESESLCWNKEESRKAQENASKYVAGCPDGSDWFRWMNDANTSHVIVIKNDEGRGKFTFDTVDKHSVSYGKQFTMAHDMAVTLEATDYKDPMIVCYDGQNCQTDTEKSYTLMAGRADDHHISNVCYPKVTGALCANSHPGSYTGQDAFNNMLPVIKVDKPGRKYIVRRLTTTECARLQGFPDWWVDGANGSKSNIYKMWGNGIALPCAADVIGRLAKKLNSGG